MKEKVIADPNSLQDLIQDLAKRLAEKEEKEGPFYFVGIHTRGITLAHRLAQILSHDSSKIGSLDINLYRDDLSLASDMPIVRETKVPFPVDGAQIMLIDDVLFTGRTIRSALDALVDLGRPKKIELLVLIDRGGRELPIQADYSGMFLKVEPGENVQVKFRETDGLDQIAITREGKER